MTDKLTIQEYEFVPPSRTYMYYHRLYDFEKYPSEYWSAPGGVCKDLVDQTIKYYWGLYGDSNKKIIPKEFLEYDPSSEFARSFGAAANAVIRNPVDLLRFDTERYRDQRDDLLGEIQRLRGEVYYMKLQRDEARQEACKSEAAYQQKADGINYDPLRIAKSRKWNCFETTKDQK
jgi:hypothetical protein